MIFGIKRRFAKMVGKTFSVAHLLPHIKPGPGGNFSTSAFCLSPWDVDLASLAELSSRSETLHESLKISFSVSIQLPKGVLEDIHVPADRVSLDGHLLVVRKSDGSAWRTDSRRIKGFLFCAYSFESGTFAKPTKGSTEPSQRDQVKQRKTKKGERRIIHMKEFVPKESPSPPKESPSSPKVAERPIPFLEPQSEPVRPKPNLRESPQRKRIEERVGSDNRKPNKARLRFKLERLIQAYDRLILARLAKEEYIERLEIRKEALREQIDRYSIMSERRALKLDQLDLVMEKYSEAVEELGEIEMKLGDVSTKIEQIRDCL